MTCLWTQAHLLPKVTSEGLRFKHLLVIRKDRIGLSRCPLRSRWKVRRKQKGRSKDCGLKSRTFQTVQLGRTDTQTPRMMDLWTRSSTFSDSVPGDLMAEYMRSVLHVVLVFLEAD